MIIFEVNQNSYSFNTNNQDLEYPERNLDVTDPVSPQQFYIYCTFRTTRWLSESMQSPKNIE